jgi:hypothetical protein
MAENNEVDRLINEIVDKLKTDKLLLARSLEHGRIVWRRDRSTGRRKVKVQTEF